jgi:hypothetical protein
MMIILVHSSHSSRLAEHHKKDTGTAAMIVLFCLTKSQKAEQRGGMGFSAT